MDEDEKEHEDERSAPGDGMTGMRSDWFPLRVRPDVVARVGRQLADGTYDPPVEQVVDRLVDVLRGSGGRRFPGA